ncbi:hypothetical protein FDECE_565 [Fusarium decemcellulare]|nr:hypothetical protein FDECE_565 [Fusarium decemcellulare]
MALAISSNARSKSYLFGAGSSCSDPSESSLPMTWVMSYQYPPLPHPGNEMDMTPPGYMPSYTVPSQQLSSLGMTNVHDQPLSNQEHDTNMKGGFSRSNGIPLPPSEADIQQQQMGSSADKKRNKLGYHRPKRTSASSSPAASTSKPAESSKQPFNPAASQPAPVTVSTAAEVAQAEGFPPEMRAPVAPAPNHQPFEMESQTLSNWVLADTNQSPTSKPDELNPTWQSYPSDSPMSAQFSPFTPMPPSSAGWTSGGSEPASHEDMAWAQYGPPVRSMSYGGEPLAGHRPSQYSLVPPGPQYERRASTLSDVYTTSMGDMVPGFDVDAGSSMGTPVPLSAGVVPSSRFTGWNQSQQHPTYTYPRNTEAYGGWEQGHPLQAADPSQQLGDNGSSATIYRRQ